MLLGSITYTWGMVRPRVYETLLWRERQEHLGERTMITMGIQ
jgi:hypothetical protein